MTTPHSVPNSYYELQGIYNLPSNIEIGVNLLNFIDYLIQQVSHHESLALFKAISSKSYDYGESFIKLLGGYPINQIHRISNINSINVVNYNCVCQSKCLRVDGICQSANSKLNIYYIKIQRTKGTSLHFNAFDVVRIFSNLFDRNYDGKLCIFKPIIYVFVQYSTTDNNIVKLAIIDEIRLISKLIHLTIFKYFAFKDDLINDDNRMGCYFNLTFNNLLKYGAILVSLDDLKGQLSIYEILQKQLTYRSGLESELSIIGELSERQLNLLRHYYQDELDRLNQQPELISYIKDCLIRFPELCFCQIGQFYRNLIRYKLPDFLSSSAIPGEQQSPLTGEILMNDNWFRRTGGSQFDPGLNISYCVSSSDNDLLDSNFPLVKIIGRLNKLAIHLEACFLNGAQVSEPSWRIILNYYCLLAMFNLRTTTITLTQLKQYGDQMKKLRSEVNFGKLIKNIKSYLSKSLSNEPPYVIYHNSNNIVLI